MQSRTNIDHQRARREVPREIGRIRGERGGPTLIAVAGVHGNEYAGIAAATKVLTSLAEDDRGLCGELVVLAGNRAALADNVRYCAKDLNRQWTAEHVAQLRKDGPSDAEDRELLELLAAVESVIAEARGPVYFMDLHTTSASGVPFVVFGDTIAQRRFAFEFPLPAILGLEEQVDGVMGAYFTEQGCIAIGIEGGQHEDPRSVDSLEACLWVGLLGADLVPKAPEYAGARALLAEQWRDLPPVMEVIARRSITADDEFVMEPGFSNLAFVHKGQLLARDRDGEIRAKRNGYVMLPLYQGLGNDGYFFGRVVGGLRLGLAEHLRRHGLSRVLPFLPGVRRDPSNRDHLEVDTRIARFYPLDVFHLFGYRRIRQDGEILKVGRRGG